MNLDRKMYISINYSYKRFFLYLVIYDTAPIFYGILVFFSLLHLTMSFLLNQFSKNRLFKLTIHGVDKAVHPHKYTLLYLVDLFSYCCTESI